MAEKVCLCSKTADAHVLRHILEANDAGQFRIRRLHKRTNFPQSGENDVDPAWSLFRTILNAIQNQIAEGVCSCRWPHTTLSTIGEGLQSVVLRELLRFRGCGRGDSLAREKLKQKHAEGINLGPDRVGPCHADEFQSI